MKIQDIYIHGKSCECDNCKEEEKDYIVFDNGEQGFAEIYLGDQLNLLEDQFGNRYYLIKIEKI